eukprot:PITA_18913
MSEGQRHHLFNRKKEEDNDNVNINSGFADQGSDYRAGSGDNAGSGYNADTGYKADYGNDGQQGQSQNYGGAQKEVKHDQRKEHGGELGTMAAGGYALYEKQEAKKDPENARRPKTEEEVAGAGAVGTGGYAFHERHEKKQDEKTEEAEGGRKNRHNLF